MIVHGDCVALMAELPEGSVDAIVTDPPYLLTFMGRAWDHAPAPFEGQMMHQQWAEQAFRVLKPGGHLLAFGGTRTYHRLACAIEDAGFEIRDCLAWLYGSGFPKSLDVSKAIDKAAGAEREVVGIKASNRPNSIGNQSMALESSWSEATETAPATPEAQQWQGWGTALKPAHEPIVMARKPLAGTVAANVLEHGTGALNVDGCRIGMSDEDRSKIDSATWVARDLERTAYGDYETDGTDQPMRAHPSGRWPANVVLDEQAAAMLDEQTGELKSGDLLPGHVRGDGPNVPYGGGGVIERAYGGDSGGASRFLYVAKASSAERNAGLDGFEAVDRRADTKNSTPRSEQIYEAMGRLGGPRANSHPTVKPIELMRWLVRLVTPPGGTVLDPFTGSGTTGCAAALEGFNFVGMEREAEYVKIAQARIEWWSRHPDGLEIMKALEAERERKVLRDAGQLDLLS